jgi:hypothetical protein
MSKRFRVIEEPANDTGEICYKIEDTQTGDKLPGAYEIKEEAEEACVMHNAKDG